MLIRCLSKVPRVKIIYSQYILVDIGAYTRFVMCLCNKLYSTHLKKIVSQRGEYWHTIYFMICLSELWTLISLHPITVFKGVNNNILYSMIYLLKVWTLTSLHIMTVLSKVNTNILVEGVNTGITPSYDVSVNTNIL